MVEQKAQARNQQIAAVLPSKAAVKPRKCGIIRPVNDVVDEQIAQPSGGDGDTKSQPFFAKMRRAKKPNGPQWRKIGHVRHHATKRRYQNDEGQRARLQVYLFHIFNRVLNFLFGLIEEDWINKSSSKFVSAKPELKNNSESRLRNTTSNYCIAKPNVRHSFIF